MYKRILNEDDFLKKLKNQDLLQELKKTIKVIRKYKSARSKI